MFIRAFKSNFLSISERYLPSRAYCAGRLTARAQRQQVGPHSDVTGEGDGGRLQSAAL